MPVCCNVFRSLAAFTSAALLILTATPACPAEPGDWPRWRGPNADGVADGRKLPTHWSRTDTIRWSVTLPGWGASSPVVWGSRVFVTTETSATGRKSLLTLWHHRQ